MQGIRRSRKTTTPGRTPYRLLPLSKTVAYKVCSGSLSSNLLCLSCLRPVQASFCGYRETIWSSPAMSSLDIPPVLTRTPPAPRWTQSAGKTHTELPPLKFREYVFRKPTVWSITCLLRILRKIRTFCFYLFTKEPMLRCGPRLVQKDTSYPRLY